MVEVWFVHGRGGGDDLPRWSFRRRGDLLLRFVTGDLSLVLAMHVGWSSCRVLCVRCCHCMT